MRTALFSDRRVITALVVAGVAGVGFAGYEVARRYRPVGYAEARAVVNRRCVECHSDHPSSRAFPVAPKAVMLDTAGEMKQYAPRIEATVAVDRSMPLANLSGMTDDERRALARWVETGAKIP